MARKATPAPVSKEPVILDAVIRKDMSAANELALITRETDVRVRAVAQQMGYQLPADATDPDLIQRDIAANMRRSVEACLEVGRGLRVLKEACEHGSFIARLDALGVDRKVAAKFMQSAAKFSNVATSRHLLQAAGSQSKLFEMLVLDDEQLEELELTGQTGELSLDDVATMSVKELRAALRESRAEHDATQAVMSKKQARIDQLERSRVLIAKLPADDQLAMLKKEATAIAADAEGAILGGLRQALLALGNHGEERGQHGVFMAGLVGQVQAQLSALREEFNLPDVSNAADAALAGEMAQWAK